MDDTRSVTGYHAHIYFDPDTLTRAERVYEAMSSRLSIQGGRRLNKPYGAHPKGHFQIDFGPDQLGSVLAWLMLHRAGLSVLIRPLLGDEVLELDAYACWLGQPLVLRLGSLRACPGRSVRT